MKSKLSRHIPESIKQQIRINSKFGCVVPDCRNSIYEYEHLIPEFKDAEIHDPNKICLTCSNHNPRKTGKYNNEYYSKEQLIKFYNQIKNDPNPPFPTNKDFFKFWELPFTIEIGDLKLKNTESIINIDGLDYLSFKPNPDKTEYSPKILFSGRLQNSNHQDVFHIIENEWIFNYNSYDLITSNGKVQIFEMENQCLFEAIKIPATNTIKITQLSIIKFPFEIKIEKDELKVYQTINNQFKILVRFRASVEHKKAGIFLDSSKETDISKLGYSLNGNIGNHISGTGIYLGRGSGTTRIQWLKIDLLDTHSNTKKAIF